MNKPLNIWQDTIACKVFAYLYCLPDDEIENITVSQIAREVQSYPYQVEKALDTLRDSGLANSRIITTQRVLTTRKRVTTIKKMDTL